MTETLPAIERFRAAMMADPAFQAELAGYAQAEEFEQAALAWAHAHGIDLTAREVDPGAADPAGIGMFGPAPQSGGGWPPAQWLPLRFAFDGPGVDWCHFAGEPLAGPFYSDTARKVRVRPFNRRFRYRTPFGAFLAAPRDGLAPDGFIFHMSRCGSTLVAQMLAAVPKNIVVSEAEPLDTVLQLPLIDPNFPPEAHVEAVRAMVSALGRDRSGTSKRYFVKLDSWHTLALPLLRHAFPETPWIFLYRDPVEVLVSQARQPGQQTAPGVLPPQIFGISPDEIGVPDIEYAARVLARTCEAVADCWELGGGMLVNYRELPGAMFERILPHFGYVPDAGERAAMEAASKRDAKAPDMQFSADSEEKRREADAEVRAAAERHLSGVYARLQALQGAA